MTPELIAALQKAKDQGRPLLLGQVEMATQGEQRRLLDAGTDPGGLDQAVGRVGLAGGAIAGLSAPDEHFMMLHEMSARGASVTQYYGTTFHF